MRFDVTGFGPKLLDTSVFIKTACHTGSGAAKTAPHRFDAGCRTGAFEHETSDQSRVGLMCLGLVNMNHMF